MEAAYTILGLLVVVVIVGVLGELYFAERDNNGKDGE